MADFRKWILALAVLALFTGLANAQVGGSTTPLTCLVNASPEQMRAEGITELIGDIVISCTGGAPVVAGATVNQVNVTVTLPANVTSRLFPQGTINASEALLLLDEPGNTTLSGFGPSLPQTVCTTASTGCSAIASTTVTGAGGAITAAVPGTPTSPAPNAYQGVVSGNQVTFFGVPILPPVTTGVSRVIRITNIRMNANGAGSSQVIASLSTSSFAVLPINTTVPPVGQIQNGLASTGTSNSAFTSSSTAGFTPTSLQQCTSSAFSTTISNGTAAFLGTVRFTEGFGSAFKTRVAPLTNTASAAQGQGAGQNIPGVVYNSESGLIVPVSGGTAGLADFGTRLKATFSGIPAGARLFVSLFNVTATAANGVTAPTVIPAVVGGNSTSGLAELVTGEAISDGTTFPGATGTTGITGQPFGTPSSTTATGIVEITPAAGLNTATAVWEVLNTNTFATETYSFAVWMTFTSNTATTPATPALGTMNVALSFAPTSTVTTASSSAPVPRFIDTSTAKAFATVNACRTVLLFPFVTNIPGWDTGIAIANTTSDVFGTVGQTGTCQMNFFGAGATITPFNLGPASAGTGTGTGTGTTTTSGTPIAPGTVATFSVSNEGRVSANFVGYMIAVCNFQFAHGYAFVSDLGAQKWAQGYLALVLPDAVANGGRSNTFTATGGEQLVH